MSELSALTGGVGGAEGLLGSPAVGMSHHFAVLIDNAAYHLGDWTRVSGLSVTWKQLEHRTGEDGNYATYLPGTTTYEPITLSRAASAYSRVVQSWLSQTSSKPTPQSGTIQLVDFTGLAIVQWRLSEFFPVAWSIESFDAAGAKPAIETLKLAHTGFLNDDFTMLSPI